jgi:predicted kinase
MTRIRITTGTGKYFVIVSGLPGSGKSTLAQQLALALGLQFLDKDAILERLFESKGVGDTEWRRALSRESDLLFRAEAATLPGAVLVSHWHLPGMPANSGTPTNWLSKLSAKVVNVHCECPAEVAADRWISRNRHPGHLDSERSHAEVLTSIHKAASYARLNIVPRIDVDTSQTPKLDDVLSEIRKALTLRGR